MGTCPTQNTPVRRERDAALVEQARAQDLFHAAIGTSTELAAYIRLRAAGSQVSAREAWVHWVDDASYRGLNSGPFELHAQEPGNLHQRIGS